MFYATTAITIYLLPRRASTRPRASRLYDDDLLRYGNSAISLLRLRYRTPGIPAHCYRQLPTPPATGDMTGFPRGISRCADAPFLPRYRSDATALRTAHRYAWYT